MPLSRKIILSIILLAIAVGIGYAIYFVFFRAPTTRTPSPTPGAEAPGTLPLAGVGLPRAGGAVPGGPTASPIARGGLTLAAPLISTRATAPSVGPDGKSISYYDQNQGLFYRVAEDGTQTPLSDKKFFNVKDVTWAPKQQKAIIEYPDGSNILFDFATQQQVTIPKHWEDFSFSPDGNALAGKSIGTDPDNRWLVVSNADGSGATPIEPLGNNADKVTVAWSPANDVVAFSKTGTEIGFGREEILPIGFRGENLRGLTVEGFGFQPQWMPGGRKLVYSVYSQDSSYKPELWVVDGSGGSLGDGRRRLNIDTWADKCTAADARTLYCAVPTDLPEGVGFDRSVANETTDQIWRVDVNTGVRALVAEPDVRAAYSDLAISADGRTLFLHEAASGMVRKISL